MRQYTNLRQLLVTRNKQQNTFLRNFLFYFIYSKKYMPKRGEGSIPIYETKYPVTIIVFFHFILSEMFQFSSMGFNISYNILVKRRHENKAI
jgi:hypothetical protein